MKPHPLNERALQVFKKLVERYIREGQPVGSKSLAEESFLGLSSATIRNIMSELENAGYLCSPHTSAGRIPTAQGYRLFVDTLLTVQPLQEAEIQHMQEKLSSAPNTNTILARASSLLSNITKLAGVVTLPDREQLILSQIDFLPLPENRILVILLTSHQEVQNRLIHTDRTYSADELQKASNYLNQHYAGKELREIRRSLLGDLQADQENIEHIMQIMLNTTEELCADEEESKEYMLAGEANLLCLVEETGLSHLQTLFEAFNQKRELLHLLNQSLMAQSLQIFIGEESGTLALEAFSIITAPYSINGKIMGVLGVIGSTRMPYDKVIPAVDVTAKLLSVTMG